MLLSLLPVSAGAQQLPGLSSDQLRQLQDLQDRSASAPQSVNPQQTILEPNASPNPYLPMSRLEQLFATRAKVNLRQFGYDQLGQGRSVALPQMGAVQDSYILGPGDEIVVSLRGQENAEYRAVVDRDGRVVLPRLNPVLASGRTLGDFRSELANAIHRAYVSTDGFVSVGHLRQVSVLVSGEVGSPGVRTLTGLSTALDAILVSGGIRKGGSLRNVTIIRGGRRLNVDLYAVLTGMGGLGQNALADGDKIVVPPLGPVVAVAGWVRRPAIYEIRGHAISMRELLRLAGGLVVRGKYRFSVLRENTDGRNQLIPLDGETGTISDSDILFVQPAASATSSMATVSGATPLAGQYPSGTKLSEYLKSPGMLGEDPYTLFGVISRRDPQTLIRTLTPFTPVAVLNGTEDMLVQGDDIVRVISAKEARVLFAAVRQYQSRRQASDEALRNPQSPTINDTTTNSATALRQLAETGSPSQDRQNMQSGDRGDALLAQQLQQGAAPGGQQYPSPYPAQNAPYGSAYPSQMSGQIQNPDNGGDPYGNRYANGMQTAFPYGQGRREQQEPFTENLQESPRVPGQTPANIEVSRIEDMASQLRVDPLVLINFLEDHAVNVDGAVEGPGLYLVGPDADIKSLLAAAGGLANWADKSAVEVISTSVDPNSGKSRTERRDLSLANGTQATYVVAPHDEVRVNEIFTAVGVGSVTVQGEVRHVGTYQIVRGEHLSDLLARAGGLTESAYPYGTVFLRKSAAQRERESFKREAQEIEDQLLLAMSRRDPNAKLSPDAFVAMQSYVNQLKNQTPLGRVAVAADPAVLAANPALDPLLEPGDVVYLPQRPYSVAVLGEVLQPGAVPYRQDMSAGDYIERAGGYSRFADTSETILVLPDGSARPLSHGWFHFEDDDIPPGSTIFVARDISGLDLHQIIVDTTAIMSQLAVSAASLAVLSTQVK